MDLDHLRSCQASGAGARQRGYERYFRIFGNFDEKISVEHLAGLCAMSEQNSRRVFHMITGKSPHDYLAGFRVAIAARLLRSTGDATLHIKSVRPKCSCTTVKYDSVVAPGKTGTITADVAIWVFRSELFTKSATVTSDAVNDSVVKFSVEALLMPFIDASLPMIVFQPSDTVLDITMCSAKKDLVVRSVSFVTKQIAEGLRTQPLDQTAPLRFTWTPTDSTRAADGYRVYRLRLVKPKVKETMFGEFVMRTNHASKAEFTLRGSTVEWRRRARRLHSTHARHCAPVCSGGTTDWCKPRCYRPISINSASTSAGKSSGNQYGATNSGTAGRSGSRGAP